VNPRSIAARATVLAVVLTILGVGIGAGFLHSWPALSKVGVVFAPTSLLSLVLSKETQDSVWGTVIFIGGQYAYALVLCLAWTLYRRRTVAHDDA